MTQLILLLICFSLWFSDPNQGSGNTFIETECSLRPKSLEFRGTMETTYGFKSCIMEKLGFIIPRLFIGVIVQVLCSYSTLPLYVIVTQLGSMFKPGIFDEFIHSVVEDWAVSTRERRAKRRWPNPNRADGQLHRLENQPRGNDDIDEPATHVDQATIASILELASPNPKQETSSP